VEVAAAKIRKPLATLKVLLLTAAGITAERLRPFPPQRSRSRYRPRDGKRTTPVASTDSSPS